MLIIWIDFSDETKQEYMVRFDDYEINKKYRFFETNRDKLMKEIEAICILNRVKEYCLFDTTT